MIPLTILLTGKAIATKLTQHRIKPPTLWALVFVWVVGKIFLERYPKVILQGHKEGGKQTSIGLGKDPPFGFHIDD